MEADGMAMQRLRGALDELERTIDTSAMQMDSAALLYQHVLPELGRLGDNASLAALASAMPSALASRAARAAGAPAPPPRIVAAIASAWLRITDRAE